MHPEKEEALKHAKEAIAKTYDAMHSYLNRCGLSGDQIDTTFGFFTTITKTQGSMAEIFQQVHAEQIDQIYRDRDEALAEIAAEEAEAHAQHDHAVQYSVGLRDIITWGTVVMARSRREAEEVALVEYQALEYSRWTKEIDSGEEDPTIEFSVETGEDERS